MAAKKLLPLNIINAFLGYASCLWVGVLSVMWVYASVGSSHLTIFDPLGVCALLFLVYNSDVPVLSVSGKARHAVNIVLCVLFGALELVSLLIRHVIAYNKLAVGYFDSVFLLLIVATLFWTPKRVQEISVDKVSAPVAGRATRCASLSVLAAAAIAIILIYRRFDVPTMLLALIPPIVYAGVNFGLALLPAMDNSLIRWINKMGFVIFTGASLCLACSELRKPMSGELLALLLCWCAVGVLFGYSSSVNMHKAKEYLAWRPPGR